MKTIQSVQSIVKDSYIAVVIGLLGVFAFISAVLIAYPALAYLGSKLFM
jgi:hypothetical protein